MLEWSGTKRAGTLSQSEHWQICSRTWQVDLACGLDNELLTVTELEKCEYLITGTTPALCISLEQKGNVKDEL